MEGATKAPERPAGRAPAEGRTLVRASVLVSALSFVPKVLGIFRDAAAASIFGAGAAMDAFVFAKSIADMLASWTETPVRSAFVPLFTRKLHDEGEEGAWRVASNLVNTLALALLALVGGLAVIFGAIWYAFGAGFGAGAGGGAGEVPNWLAGLRLGQITVVSVAFSVSAVVLGSISNVYGRQFVPAIGRVINGAVVLLGVLFLGPRYGVLGYAWAFLLAGVLYGASQTDVLVRNRHLYRPVVAPRAPEIREVGLLALPLFIATLSPFLDTQIEWLLTLRFLPVGSLAVLSYARSVSGVATELLVTVVVAVLLPHFAQLTVAGRIEELKRRAAQTVSGYLFCMIPVAVFLVVGAREVIEVVYRRGRFSPEDALVTAAVLAILACGDPLMGVGQILAQIHIARGDTKTPMKVGFWRIGFKAVTSVALLPFLGLYGLAASSSLANLFRTLQLWWRLPREIRPGWDLLGRTAAGLIASGAIAGAATWGALATLPEFGHGTVPQLVRIGLAGFVTCAVYLAAVMVFAREVPVKMFRALRG